MSDKTFELYGHINNGGVSFSVTNEYGPTIVVSSSHFGNNEHTHKIYCTKEFLRQLGEMYIKASREDLGGSYTIAVRGEGEQDEDCCSYSSE